VPLKKLIAVLSLAACFFQAAAFAEAPAREALVTRVVDGDTIRVNAGEKIRLIGINTPEYEPWKPFVQFYGKEAAEYSRGLLTGKKVRLVPDADPYDKYGRTLAYVYLEDGTFVNELLVREGYARAVYYAPNGLHYADLKAAEKEAKAAGKGVWSRKKKASHIVS
jgi:micrococcal nuclease